jgi:hypothetical protein
MRQIKATRSPLTPEPHTLEPHGNQFLPNRSAHRALMSLLR